MLSDRERQNFRIVARPGMCVVISRPGVDDKPVEIRYDASNLQVVIHDAKYKLAFTCSGALTFVEIDEVVSIEFYKGHENMSPQHCSSCDQRLVSWPMNDPRFAKTIAEIKAATEKA